MEIRSAIGKIGRLVQLRMWVCLFLLYSPELFSQPTFKSYTIRDGKMFITLGRKIPDASLDSFISQYDLYDLDLKEFIKTNRTDSLKKLGWSIDVDNKVGYVLSKRLGGVENIMDPATKIIFAENDPRLAAMFPPVSSGVKYGYNRFKNKYPFATHDSIVTFFMRGNTNAKKVILSGSFINWSPTALAMRPTDSGWIANVKLGPGKYWYKFIIDGNWTIDKDNSFFENDGRGNDNSVYFKTNVVFKLNSYANAKRVYLSGSFNDWRPRELLMNETETGWSLPLYLANGTHTYRFVADGKWFEDPANPNHFRNEFGEFNSVISLGKPYLFSLPGFVEAKQVILTGSFNGWRRDELYMTKTANGWQLPYVLGPGNYEFNFIVDGKAIKSSETGSGNLFFVIEPNYTFRLKGYPNAKTVFLAGDFNNWTPNAFPMKKEGDEWSFKVNISPGKHLYKFVVDGRWILDPGNKLWEQNAEHTGNSVCWIENNVNRQ
jgi:hypothetical protein